MMNEMTVLNGVIKGEMGLDTFGLKEVTKSGFAKTFLDSQFTFETGGLVAESKNNKFRLSQGLIKNLLNELIEGKIDVVTIQ